MAAGAASGVAIADTPGFVVRVVGFALVIVDGLIFGYYAARNARANPFEGQRAFWRYLVAIGVTAPIVGAAGLVGFVVESDLVAASGDLALFLFVAAIAFALREIYYNSSLAPAPEERRISLATVRRLELGLFLVIALEWVAVVVIDRAAVTTAIKAVASLTLVGYGTLFNERLESLTGGTSLDTLRLHLFPLLAIAGLLGAVGAGRVLGAPAFLIAGIETALVVLLGGLLLPATIRLQQNVANR